MKRFFKNIASMVAIGTCLGCVLMPSYEILGMQKKKLKKELVKDEIIDVETNASNILTNIKNIIERFKPPRDGRQRTDKDSYLPNLGNTLLCKIKNKCFLLLFSGSDAGWSRVHNAQLGKNETIGRKYDEIIRWELIKHNPSGPFVHTPYIKEAKNKYCLCDFVDIVLWFSDGDETLIKKAGEAMRKIDESNVQRARQRARLNIYDYSEELITFCDAAINYLNALRASADKKVKKMGNDNYIDGKFRHIATTRECVEEAVSFVELVKNGLENSIAVADYARAAEVAAAKTAEAPSVPAAVDSARETANAARAAAACARAAAENVDVAVGTAAKNVDINASIVDSTIDAAKDADDDDVNVDRQLIAVAQQVAADARIAADAAETAINTLVHYLAGEISSANFKPSFNNDERLYKPFYAYRTCLAH